MKGRCIKVSLKKGYDNGTINKTEESLPESICSSVLVAPKRWCMKETPLCACHKGSMTVEAAIVLPLLACFFSFLLFFFRIMQVQLEVQQALESTVERLAIASHLEKEDNSSAVLYHVVAKSMVMTRLSNDENIDKYVTGGSLGISLLDSSFTEDYILISADYQMKFPVGLLGKRAFLLHQQAGYRKWTGWHAEDTEDEADLWVYIAESGSVYHKTSDCTYLDLSIRSVMASEIQNLRNESGQKYRECEICADNNTAIHYYITNYGNCYHKDLNCSGIKRTVIQIRMSEAEGRRACTKCWN